MKILKRAAAVAVILMGATACSDSNEYVQEAVTGPSPFHGIHGITVTKDGKILAGSVVGRAIYEVDPESGTASIYEASPVGMADDLEEGPDGTLAWTEDGRLFATQVFLGDTLYELDPAGENPPRKIMAGMGGLNGFDFGPDGKLYGPLWFKKQIVRVDVDSGTDVATGLDGPAMLKLAGDGALYVSENTGGRISRVDIETGERSVVADNLSAPEGFDIGPDGRFVVAEVGTKRIVAIDIESDEREIIKEDLPIGFEAPENVPPLFIPTGVVAAANGDIYYSSDIDVRIYRLRKN